MAVPLPLVEEARTIDALVRAAAARWPSSTALRTLPDGASMTYARLEREVERTARALQGRGVGPADRIAVMMANRIEYPVLWLACARLGATMVPVNHRSGLLDTKYILEHSGASMLVVADEHARTPRDAAVAASRSPTVVAVGDLGPGKSAADSPVESPSRPDTAVNIQYTSGSTGMPKGCVLWHSYWLTIARKNVLEVPGLGADDVLLSAQPFSYMDPQWNLVSSMAAGATFVLVDAFHPSTFWSTVASSGATFVYCLGVMPMLMLHTPPSEAERTHRLRLVACSGINPAHHAELERRFGVPWVETYGMTEIGNGLAVTLADRHRTVGTGRMGRATRYREVRVVDADDRAVPRGVVGELVVRGVGMMEGYLDDPDATAHAFRNGWFHTGDQVWMDDEDFVYFVGRNKDMIRRSGENISAVEVEDALQRHPSVALVACVAVPDEIRAEEVKAYVVLTEGYVNDISHMEDGLARFCESVIAGYKVPRYWQYCSALPLTASGKVNKGALAVAGDDPRTGSWDRVEQVWR
jgi:crotonobetaine/carnitine-CoA ligase